MGFVQSNSHLKPPQEAKDNHRIPYEQCLVTVGRKNSFLTFATTLYSDEEKELTEMMNQNEHGREDKIDTQYW